jgi:ATP-binding cassette subfamily B (MDR/TAP) protein 6
VSLLSALVFSIGPALVDAGIGLVFFAASFDAWFGLVIGLTLCVYIGMTALLTGWRIQWRRRLNELEGAATGRAVDSLMNFETVKYYGAESVETAVYGKALTDVQWADWCAQTSLVLLNAVQNGVMTLGLFAGCLLCVIRVKDGVLTVGDFVLFLTYLTQLYAPLNLLGTYYRSIQVRG